VNIDKTKYVVLPGVQNAGRNHNIWHIIYHISVPFRWWKGSKYQERPYNIKLDSET